MSAAVDSLLGWRKGSRSGKDRLLEDQQTGIYWGITLHVSTPRIKHDVRTNSGSNRAHHHYRSTDRSDGTCEQGLGSWLLNVPSPFKERWDRDTQTWPPPVSTVMDKLTVISGCLFLAADIFAIASIANPDWINTGESAGRLLALVFLLEKLSFFIQSGTLVGQCIRYNLGCENQNL